MIWINRHQRLEGVALFISSLYFYLHLNYSVLWFLILLLSFDISMVGYLVNNKIGAHVYNIGHSLVLPTVLLVIGITSQDKNIIGLSLIWFAHIGMDRALGFGLKMESGFHDTHLGKISK